MKILSQTISILALFFSYSGLSAQEKVEPNNPILKIDDPNFLYFADPAAEVYNGRVYVYCSHDPEYATDWETMMDYGLLSSSDLKTWTNHGVIVRPSEFSWVRSNMNAPDAAYKDGWYYLYYPGNIFEVGVVKSRTPEGPWEEAAPNKITDIFDPTVFVDDDGQAYIYGNYQPQLMGANSELEWYVAGAKLKDNMIELDGEWHRLSDEKINEAVHIFKREGKYYFTARKDSQTAYFMADEPLPIDKHAEFKGYITHAQRDAPAHNSVIEFKGRWYLFYQRGDVNFGRNCRRSACFDEIYFNADGTIIPVEYSVNEDYLSINLQRAQ